MHHVYSDDFASLGERRAGGLIPEKLRRAAGAAVFVGLVIAMGTWAYRLGTRDAAEVPIIRAMEGPARVQPEEPGGVQAAHQGLEVNTVLSGAPAPQPMARQAPVEALVAEALLADEDAPQGELAMTAVPQAFDAAAGSTELPVPVQESPAGGDEALVTPAPDLRSPEQLAAAEAEVQAGAEAEDEPGEAAPVAAGPRPRSRPAGLVVARAEPTPAAPAPTAPARTEAAPTPAAAPAREVASVAPGSRMVQLGAFDSEAIAREAWAGLVARNGDILGAKSLYVERTTANARVFYRLRVAGFDSTDETREMCEALRGRGIDCIPVTRN